MESLRPAAAAGGAPRPAVQRRGRGKDRSIAWTVTDGWHDLITGPGAADWTNLADDPRAVRIKANPNRLVWRVTIGGRTCYVKEFVRSSSGGRLRHVLRGPAASIEWRAGREAVQRGVPCTRPVACGLGTTRSYLVSAALEPAMLLSDAWVDAGRICDDGLRARRSRALCEAVARLLANAHARGFYHGDDHPRNILIVERNDGSQEAVYADLARARWKDRPNDAAAVRSLAQLSQWFRSRSSPVLRLRFLVRYCRLRCAAPHSLPVVGGGERPTPCDEARSTSRGRGFDGHVPMQTDATSRGKRLSAVESCCSSVAMARRYARAIMAAANRLARALERKRDRRIMSTNRYFASIRLTRGVHAQVTLTFRQRDLFPEPSLPDQTVAQWHKTLAAWLAAADSRSECGSTMRTRRVADLPGTRLGPTGRHRADQPRPAWMDNVLVSSSRVTGITGRIGWMLRGSPMQRAFFAGHRLRNRDLPCRWPVALIARSVAGRHAEALLLCDAQPVCEGLVSFLSRSDVTPSRRRRVCKAMARLVAAMAERRVSAATVSLNTFGVVDAGTRVMVDNPRGIVFGGGRPSHHRWITTKALRRLMCSRQPDRVDGPGGLRRTDALRYLKALAGRDWRQWWYRMVAGDANEDRRA